MISRKHLLWMLVVTLSDWVLAIVALKAMPRQVPVHWDIHGRVDGLGSSAELALSWSPQAEATTVEGRSVPAHGDSST